MSQNIINTRIQLKRDTSAAWTKNNPVLLDGEMILVDTAEGDLRVKIGDGVKTYTQLPFNDEALRNLINSNYEGLADVAKTGSYLDLTDVPEDNSCRIVYSSCDTESSAQVKVVVLDDTSYTLKDKDILYVKFANSNSFNSTDSNKITFKIGDNTYNIYSDENGNYTSGTNTTFYGYANRWIWYRVDTTNKRLIWLSHSWDNTNTYTNASLGQGYGTCTTAASTTAKVVTLSSYTLSTGGIISVKFTNSVPANATMNVNSKGNKEIWYRGTKIISNVINANDIATFIYDGTRYQLISIDKDNNTTYTSKEAVKDGTEVSLVTTGEKYAWNNIVSFDGDADTLDGLHASEFAASSHNQASNTITSMTGYSKPSSTSAIAAGDSLNTAIGKLEKALDSKQSSGSYAASSHTHDDRYYTESEINTKLSGKLNTSLKGAASGLAELDSNGKVPSAQLPSYVDDVLEYKNKASFPATGESGKIYISQDNNKTYRWSGSAYVEISPSLALGETSATAYRGDRGKIAYDHSQTAHAPSNAEANQNAFSNVVVGSTTIAADSKTDTLTLAAGSNITITPDANNDKITITSTNTWRGIQNNLTSDSTTDSLSAAQGKVLKGLVDGKAASSHTHTKSQITDFPTIPTKTSQLTNDSGYLTEHPHIDKSPDPTEKKELLFGESFDSIQLVKTDDNGHIQNMVRQKLTLPNIRIENSLNAHSSGLLTNATITAALENKADMTHTHTVNEIGADAYGSAEIALEESKAYTDAALENKADMTHTHTKSQITDFPSSLPANGGNADTVDGLHANGFIKVNSSNAYDCNTLYDAGLYLCNGSATNTPNDLTYGSLFVMPYRHPYGNSGPDYCAQIFIPNGDASDTSMWYRTSLQNTWDAWKKTLSSENGVLSDTLVAQSNTNYTTPQVRNATMSTSAPSGGSNGQIHYQYS